MKVISKGDNIYIYLKKHEDKNKETKKSKCKKRVLFVSGYKNIEDIILYLLKNK